MDLRFTPEENRVPPGGARLHPRQPARRHPCQNETGPSARSKEDTVRWQRILNAKGWAGVVLAEGMGRARLDARSRR